MKSATSTAKVNGARPVDRAISSLIETDAMPTGETIL